MTESTLIRLPTSLHRALKAIALSQDTSMVGFITQAVESYRPTNSAAPLVIVEKSVGRPHGPDKIHKFSKFDAQREFARDSLSSINIPDRMFPRKPATLDMAFIPYQDDYSCGDNEAAKAMIMVMGESYIDHAQQVTLELLNGKKAEITVKPHQGRFLPACDMSYNIVSTMGGRTAFTSLHLFILAQYAGFNIIYLDSDS